MQMSIEAIRCPGCHNLVNVAELEKHYGTSHHDGIVQGATTITTANPNADYRPSTQQGTPMPVHEIEGPPHSWQGYPTGSKRPHAFDSPVWGPLLRRYFPHIIFGALTLGIIIGILVW
jgi:hypothetical protein